MRINVSVDWLITILITILYSLFTILNTNSNRNYILFAIAVLVFMLSKCQHSGFLIHITTFHKSTVAFLLFCCASMIWAYDATYAKVQAISIFYILIILFLVYEACKYDETINRLILAIKWGGVIVALYSIFIYGISGITSAIQNSLRIDNVFGNTNTIAIQCALSVVIFFVCFLFDEKKKPIITILSCIPCLLLIGASGSRKGLIILSLGFVVAFYYYIKSTHSASKKIQRIVLFIIVSICLLYIIMNSSLFTVIIERMQGIGYGTNTVKEQSALLRDMMIIEGWKQFKMNPILGIGIGCPRIINMSLIGADAYLHNNFIELLCGGGVVGFALFYWMYFYNFKTIICSKDISQNAILCLTLISVQVVTDWGMVSYYSESTYFFFMMCFLQADISKRKGGH